MRVLVVDDTITNRILATRILEKRGHSVRAVQNGKEALCLLEQEDFDVVLMDLQMPIMDGIETTRIIRNFASAVRRHDIPVIALSAAAEYDGKKQCLEVGMSDYLSKPLRTESFLKIIEQYAP